MYWNSGLFWSFACQDVHQVTQHQNKWPRTMFLACVDPCTRLNYHPFFFSALTTILICTVHWSRCTYVKWSKITWSNENFLFYLYYTTISFFIIFNSIDWKLTVTWLFVPRDEHENSVYLNLFRYIQVCTHSYRHFRFFLLLNHV